VTARGAEVSGGHEKTVVMRCDRKRGPPSLP
jgi:hypothetical protein